MYESQEDITKDTILTNEDKKVFIAERVFQGDIANYTGSSLAIRGTDDKRIKVVDTLPDQGNYQVFEQKGQTKGEHLLGYLLGRPYEVAFNDEMNYSKLTGAGGVTLREDFNSKTSNISFKIPNVTNQLINELALGGKIESDGSIAIPAIPSKEIENRRFFTTVSYVDNDGKETIRVYSNCKVKVTSQNDSVEDYQAYAIEITPEQDNFTSLTGDVGYSFKLDA